MEARDVVLEYKRKGDVWDKGGRISGAGAGAVVCDGRRLEEM